MPNLKVEKPVYRDLWAAVIFVPFALFAFAGYHVYSLATGGGLTTGLSLFDMMFLEPASAFRALLELAAFGLALGLLVFLPKVFLYFAFGVLACIALSMIVNWIELGFFPQILSLPSHLLISNVAVIVVAVVVASFVIRQRVSQTAAVLDVASQLFKRNGFLAVYSLGYLLFVFVLRFFTPFPILGTHSLNVVPTILSFVGFVWTSFVVTCLCQTIVSTATMICLEGEATEKPPFGEIVRRSLTTSFGSICLGALVMPFKVFVGVDDSHAYAKMILNNTGYWESCRDPLQSRLEQKNLFLPLVWMAMHIQPLSLLISLLLAVVMPNHYLHARSLRWDWHAILMAFGTFMARMQVESTPMPVLLKYEEDPEGFAAKYPAIKGEQTTEARGAQQA